ncbi:MAG: peptide chain release factor N(5)-glutamine methyltransferase [Bacteroidota bacterium]|jgi:release factor glutamine methyltransferase
MRIPSNRIEDIINFYKKELKDIYAEGELNELISMSFNFVLGFSKSELILKKKENVLQSDLLKLNFICKDLKTQKPIQYILGEAEFCGLQFKVNESVLIPRPETEELVHLVLKYVSENKIEDPRILDVGTGSGCIAISLRKKLAYSSVTAIDISESALSIAKSNANRLEAEVSFLLIDALQLSQVKDLNIPNILVSNPPYIAKVEQKKMSDNVLKYEPHLALFSHDEDAIIFYRVMISYAKQNAVKALFFELNPDYASEVLYLAEDSGFKAEIIRDINGHQRFLRAILLTG